MAESALVPFGLDAAFPLLKSLVIERTGHFYYQDKDDLLWERLRRRLRAVGARDCAQYLERLNDPALGPPEWKRLEADITIGETFFFRYAEQFAALKDTILPNLIARNGSQKRLRIWSAGCATGAEPYSLAILLSRLLGEDRENWRISIVGTDINQTFLDAARRGQFGRWALRALSPEEREDYFLPTPEKEQWQLRPEYRSLVRFERHNLLSLLDGTSPLQFTDFDLILCRNVLIYFHPETVVRIVGALRDSLVDEGWMLLGHAEPSPAFTSLLQVLNFPGTIAYRRGDAAPPEPAIPAANGAPFKPHLPWATVRQTPKPAPAPRKPAPASARAALLRQPLPELRPDRPESVLAEVRALANAGRFDTAHALCETALLAQPLDPALHFYRGLIAAATGHPDEAEKAFRRSMYLDKNFVMAHYHLGLLLLEHRRDGAGRRALANAARIAAALPADTVLDEADGLTARELRGIVRVHLQMTARTGTGG